MSDPQGLGRRQLEELLRAKKVAEKALSLPEMSKPELRAPHFEFPDIEPPQLIINAEQGIASQFYLRLVKWINEFDASLDNEYEVGVRLVSFGQTVQFHLEDMGFNDPFLISFSGTTPQGEPVELIQHVNQISILLMKMQRSNPEEPKKPFGFHAIQELYSNEDEAES